MQHLDLWQLAQEAEALTARIESGETLDEDDTARHIRLVVLVDDIGCELRDAIDFGPMIPDGFMVDYAQELAKDLGLLDDSVSWPQTCIDWAQAAKDLTQDYTLIEFEGVDYWIFAG